MVLVVRDNEGYFFVDFGIMSQQLFETALALQQQQSYDLAMAKYTEILNAQGQGLVQLTLNQQSVIYQNISAIYFEKKDYIQSYIWAKKAVGFAPNVEAKMTLDKVSTLITTPQVSQHFTTEHYIKSSLSFMPPSGWAILTAFLFLITLSLLFKKIIIYRKELQSLGKSSLINLKNWSMFLWLGLTVVSALVFIFIYFADNKIGKAIISKDNSSIQTAPGDNKPVIYAAPIGLEVDVIAEQSSYFQVRLQGAFSGWVSKSDVETISPIIKQ